MLLLGLSYPLLAHLAVLSGRPALIAASLGVLATLILLPPLRRGRLWAWAVFAAAAVGLYALSRSSAAALPLFVPPVAINAFMAWVFGHTLLQDRVPLIERLIRALHDPGEALDPAIARYARRLTATWTALFVVLAVVNLMLALCATPGGLLLAAGFEPPVPVPLAIWSLFANILNYVFVGVLFVVEYAWRQRVFPQQRYRNFFDFTQRVARLGAIFRPVSAGQSRNARNNARPPRAGQS
jgi:uncharacterized membrane protein